MCDIGSDLEPCDTWHEKIVTARKEHVCSCCGGAIAVGAKYTRHFSVADGEPWSEKLCADCKAAADEFHAAHGIIGVPSYIPEMLVNCIADGEPGSERWQSALDEMKTRRTARQAVA